MEGPYTYGTKPLDPARKEDNAEIIRMAEEGRLEEIKEKYPSVYLNKYSRLKAI